MKTQTKRSTRRLAASIVIAAALVAVSSVLAADWTVSEDTTLHTGATVDALTVEEGVTLNLAGNSLTCSSLAGSGTITRTGENTNLTLADTTEPYHVTWLIKAGTAGEESTTELYANTTPRNLFDGEDSTRVIMQKGSNNENMPLAVTYDFGDGEQKTVNKYSICGPSSNFARGPKAWTFEGSDNGTTWNELHSMTDESWTSATSKEYQFSNSTAYRYYRIKFTESADTSTKYGGPFFELNELRFYNTNPGELHVNVVDGETATVGSLTISGNVKVVKEGAGTLSGITQIANVAGSKVGLVVEGGRVAVDNSTLYVGHSGAGTLTVNGGAVDVSSSAANVNLGQTNGSSGTVNLNGGTLKTRRIVRNSNGASAALNFNGGTLQANAEHTQNGGLIADSVTTTVNEGGGTVNSGNLSIKVGAVIGGTGAMKFKGGNTITLEGANTYTGGTTIELGTKVVTSVADAKVAILDNGLTIDGSAYPSDASGIVVFEYSGLTAADIENKITFVNCGIGTAASVSEGKLLVDFVAPSWALDTNANWSDLVATYDTPAAGETVRIAASGAYTLTIDQNVAVGQIVFTGSNPNVVVNSGCIVTADTINFSAANTDYYVLNNGVVVLNGTGTTSMRFHNDSKGVYYVNAGTLLSAAQPEQGSNATPELLPEGTNQFICVASGATYDINGQANNTASVRLASGATITNSSASVTTSTKQMPQLILDGDATATITRSFGLVGSGYSKTRLDLGANTLTITGGGSSYSFFLANTTVSGTGKILVESGKLCAVENAGGEEFTLEIGSLGQLVLDRVYAKSYTDFTVGDFVNNGTDASATDAGALIVKGTLTPGNAIKKLTLENGSKVKATGTAQTVSTTFSASGTITIDASEIKEQLDAAVDQRIPVLTVPTASVPSDVTWAVSGPDARAKWVDNGGDTSTLYLAKPTGLMIIVR